MAGRGAHLVRADRGFATGGGLLARLAAPAFRRVLDNLHERLRERDDLEAPMELQLGLIAVP